MIDSDWSWRLLGWYDEHRRDLPWRDDAGPYRVWVSEIMLQQTQVETVRPYFERFLEAFPTVEALAAADEQAVLRLWQGLGYYSRARRLHQAAQLVVREHGGRLPSTYEKLQEIPGLGPYTAAAVASIAFGEPVPVVDGNVLRVYARFRGLTDDIAKAGTRKKVFAALLPIIAPLPPSDFNQAMMELGALVCRPRGPVCLLCPLRADCVAANEGRTEALPVKAKRQSVPHHEEVAGLVRCGERFLIVQRPAERMLAGMWELPGGRVEAGEGASIALRRHLHEQWQLELKPDPPFATITHAYSHFTIAVQVCAVRAETVTPEVGQWITPAQIDSFPFHTAALKAIAAGGMLPVAKLEKPPDG